VTDSCALQDSHLGIDPQSSGTQLHFQRYVIQLRKKQIYAFKYIVNADEISVYFDMPRNYTIDTKVAKEIKIGSKCYEFTVCNVNDAVHKCW
jgi:hypothetical protein